MSQNPLLELLEACAQAALACEQGDFAATGTELTRAQGLLESMKEPLRAAEALLGVLQQRAEALPSAVARVVEQQRPARDCDGSA